MPSLYRAGEDTEQDCSPARGASLAQAMPTSSAPIRATTVKKAYEPGPVTRCVVGLTILLDPSLRLPDPAAARPEVKLERPEPRGGEDERA
jgi:hypothetical protein